MSTGVNQSRLNRWAPGRLDQIEREQADLLNSLTGPESRPDAVTIATEVEALTVEASLIRLLVADREVGLSKMHRMMRPSPHGSRATIEMSRIAADTALTFLDQWGHMLTDAEIRHAVAGRDPRPFVG